MTAFRYLFLACAFVALVGVGAALLHKRDSLNAIGLGVLLVYASGHLIGKTK